MSSFRRACLLLSVACLAVPLAGAVAEDRPVSPGPGKNAADHAPKPDLHPDQATSDGTVTIGGAAIGYQAVAGTLVVHPKDWDDSGEAAEEAPAAASDAGSGAKSEGGGGHDRSAEARMFFVAYFKHGVPSASRPITFLYNGGPGSSSVWLHMGAFGPRRVVTADDSHTAAGPYRLVNNDESLLDATDLVFIDAPGTGFGRIAGKDKEKAFWGVDEDGHAFANFIAAFLGKYGRWDSPKYLFGESYGTTRSAVLSNILEQEKDVDLNGVILLSQVLDYDAILDGTGSTPGNDLPYVLDLPSFAATAWYHHKLPGNHTDLKALLAEVEHFATTDYLLALQQGAALPGPQRDAIADRLHGYTGLPTEYLKRADLRVSGGEFEHELQNDTQTTTGRLDSRFSGPSMDPLDKEAQYDPQSAAISAAYVAGFNNYVRKTLNYGMDKTYKEEIDVFKSWNFKHQPPGADMPLPFAPDVLPDLAAAIKYNPTLKVQLNAGYFDLATPFYEGVYEMAHLPMPARLQANIEYRQYESGHMVYVHVPALKQLHDNVADFIRRTDNLGTTPPAPVATH